jgi:ribonuclease P protein component
MIFSRMPYPVEGVREAISRNNMSLFSFRKDEILRKNKLIDRLFTEGSTFYIYPFKIFWLALPLETSYPAQILISVGKRTFKRAVDRNRVKRQVREVYRLHKHDLYENLARAQEQCVVGIIYTSNKIVGTEELEIKIKAVLKRLNSELNKKLNKSSSSLSEQ